MPTHPCLETPEIRAQIFEYHAGDSPTLFALALTCRQFTDSALDLLWREQRNLVWLVRTMSPKGDLWNAPEGSNELKQMKFIRGLKSEDMERFRYYSRRIRELRVEQQTTSDLPPHILSALTAYEPSQPLLPQISRLTIRIDGDTNEIACYLPSLLSSSLTDLELRFFLKFNPDGTRTRGSTITTQNLQSFLAAVARVAPSLRSLRTLYIPQVDHDYNPFFESFVMALPNLVNLSCEGLRVTPELMQHLGSKCALLKLNDVCMDKLFRVNPDSTSLFGPSRFTFLKELSLLPLSLDRLMPMLEALDSPLKKLFLTIDNEDSDIDQDCLEMLCSTIVKFKQLTTLSIRNDVPNQFFVSSLPIFSQLLGLRYLEVVTIRLLCMEELDPLIPSQIPTAWPSITRLSVTLARPFFNGSPKITLQALAEMTCRCAQLKKLSISVDLRPFQVDNPPAIGNESIEEAFFYNSALSPENIPSILRCLRIMFPSATFIEGDGKGPAGDWEEFNDMARDFFQPVVE